jgi:hypothetical protein
MDFEKEIRSVSAETLAYGIILGNVLSKLAGNPSLRLPIVEGLNQAADVAGIVAMQFGKSVSPDHTLKALRIVEEMRALVLGVEGKPKKFG